MNFVYDTLDIPNNDYPTISWVIAFVLNWQRQGQMKMQQRVLQARYFHCHMWAGDNKTVLEVQAPSFDVLCSEVRATFADIPISESFSCYAIPEQKRRELETVHRE